jgi:NADP-dependent 3-hydroxy acid dehydrogenase YdfG
MLGCHVILAARRKDRIETLGKHLAEEHKVKVLAVEMDVRDKHKVEQVIHELPDSWKHIDILINNAGLALDTLTIQEGIVDHWDTMIQTNLNGLLYVTRAILPLMLKRKTGHIINISSTAGHDHYPKGNVYSATKHAVRALSKSLRLDLLGTGIRVSDVAPGFVNTEFSTVRWKDKERAEKFYEDFDPLMAEDVADAVAFCVTRPQHVSVAEMVICPTDQASVNHLHRKHAEHKGTGGL